MDRNVRRQISRMSDKARKTAAASKQAAEAAEMARTTAKWELFMTERSKFDAEVEPKGCGHASNPDRVCSDCAWLPGAP